MRKKYGLLTIKVIKYFRNNKISKNRVRRSRNLGKFVPKITKNKNNLYSYKFFDGKIFSKNELTSFQETFKSNLEFS